MKNRNLIISLGVVASLILLALITKSCTSSRKSIELKSNDAPLVEAIEARLGKVNRFLRLNGILKPSEQVNIKSEVEGRIDKILFAEGAQVKKGDLLISLDDAKAAANLREIEAKLIYTKSEFDRASQLASSGILSTNERDKKGSELNSLKAQLEVSRVLLGKHKIYAPFDGLIGLKEISIGEYVTPGKELITLVNYSPLKVDFKVPEMDLKDIYQNQVVTVSLDGLDESYLAKVVAIDPLGDPTAHSFMVRATLENQHEVMRPGQFVHVIVPLKENERAVLVPESAVERLGDEDVIFRVVEGLAVRTIVTVGQRQEGEIEILSGVNAGELVIVAGAMKARDGRPVQIVGYEASENKTDKTDKKQTEKEETPKEGFFKYVKNFIKKIFVKEVKDKSKEGQS